MKNDDICGGCQHKLGVHSITLGTCYICKCLNVNWHGDKDEIEDFIDDIASMSNEEFYDYNQ